jgi:hypothetical protein
MWEPRRLTTLWAFTACYKDSFTSYLFTDFCRLMSLLRVFIDGGFVAGDTGR